MSESSALHDNAAIDPVVVVLTNGTDYPNQLLESLSLQGCRVRAVLTTQGALSPWRKKKKASRAAPTLLQRLQTISDNNSLAEIKTKGVQRAIGMLSRAGGVEAPVTERWASMAQEVRAVGLLNGSRLIGALAELKPDYLVLAQLGIVSKEVLQIPRFGTINAHPGLLPFVRGVGVVERALERGVPVGFTIHTVNTGIDTGKVIHRELLPILPDDSLEAIRRRSATLAVRRLADIIANLKHGPPEAATQTARYPYCKWLKADEKAAVRRLIAHGHARQLYQDWSAHFGGNVLPLDLSDHPPIAIHEVSR